MMSVGDPLPNEDSVARGCYRALDGDLITSAAFDLRTDDKGKLSADWVECKHVPEHLRNVDGSLLRLKRVLRVAQTVTFLRVGDVRQIAQNSNNLDVVENGHTNNPCHSAIIGMTGGVSDIELQEFLADLANSSRTEFLTP